MKSLTLLFLALSVLPLPAAAAWDHRRYDHSFLDRSVIEFQVTRTSFITRPWAACYRGAGVFRIETRLYAEILRGRTLRTRVATQEIFDRCAGY